MSKTTDLFRQAEVSQSEVSIVNLFPHFKDNLGSIHVCSIIQGRIFRGAGYQVFGQTG